MLPSVGITELIALGVVAILLFGKRLPEVARNVGRGYGELRKGLTEIQSTISAEIDNKQTAKSASRDTSVVDDTDEPTAPRLGSPESPDELAS
jgi:sec-independent protein translocase protein TatA